MDISNAHTGLALWPRRGAPHHWRIASDPRRTADEYQVLLGRLLTGRGLSAADVGGSVVASVVPALTPVIEQTCVALFGAAPLVVGPGVRSGLAVRTDDPREVGPDRIANGVAALARFGAPVLVLDFGTALTIDVVGAGGEYLGAIIAPGLEVAADALSRHAARLGRFELAPPPTAIAANTEHALQSGLVFGYLGLVEGLLRRARAEIGEAPVVATGDAPWVADFVAHCPQVAAYDPLLTLDGLRRIHAHQPGRP